MQPVPSRSLKRVARGRPRPGPGGSDEPGRDRELRQLHTGERGPELPQPSGPDDSETNFNGTGVNPISLTVEKVNDLCGKKLGLPTWWIDGWVRRETSPLAWPD